jgi:acyl carrier protein
MSANVLESLRELTVEALEWPEERAAAIGAETTLVEGLELDSLAQAVLLAEVEERFGFVFDLDDRDRLLAARTVGDLVAIIEQRAARA